MAGKISLLKKGETGTFLDTEFGNQVLNLLNSLAGLAVSPAGMGSLTTSENNAVLDLSPIKAALDALALQINALGGQDTFTEVIKNLTDRVKTIEDRLNNATIEGSFVCNEDGTITSTLKLNI